MQVVGSRSTTLRTVIEHHQFWIFCQHAVYLARILFAHAEVAKDVSEDFFGIDSTTCDFGKVVETLTEVFGYEIAREILDSAHLISSSLKKR